MFRQLAERDGRNAMGATRWTSLATDLPPHPQKHLIHLLAQCFMTSCLLFGRITGFVLALQPVYSFSHLAFGVGFLLFAFRQPRKPTKIDVTNVTNVTNVS